MNRSAVAIFAGAVFGICTLMQLHAAEQQVRHVRLLETDNFFTTVNLDGIAFPPYTDSVLKLPSGNTRSASNQGNGKIEAVVEIVAAGMKPGNPDNIVLPAIDPATLTIDSNSRQLFVFSGRSAASKPVSGSAANGAEKGRIIGNRFGIKNPVGMAVNPLSHRLFILDADKWTLYQIDGELAKRPDTGTTGQRRPIRKVRLKNPGTGDYRGLAYNPQDNRLYTIDRSSRKLLAIDMEGSILVVGDFPESEWREPAAMVIAPSLDQTDDPSRAHLFIASAGITAGEVNEWQIPVVNVGAR